MIQKIVVETGSLVMMSLLLAYLKSGFRVQRHDAFEKSPHYVLRGLKASLRQRPHRTTEHAIKDKAYLCSNPFDPNSI